MDAQSGLMARSDARALRSPPPLPTTVLAHSAEQAQTRGTRGQSRTSCEASDDGCTSMMQKSSSDSCGPSPNTRSSLNKA
jgi:hypothetical protein